MSSKIGKIQSVRIYAIMVKRDGKVLEGIGRIRFGRLANEASLKIDNISLISINRSYETISNSPSTSVYLLEDGNLEVEIPNF